MKESIFASTLFFNGMCGKRESVLVYYFGKLSDMSLILGWR